MSEELNMFLTYIKLEVLILISLNKILFLIFTKFEVTTFSPYKICKFWL